MRWATTHQRPFGAARQVEGDDVQAQAARHVGPDHRPQVTRVAQRQRRRQQAFGEQAALAVQVGQHTLQQRRTLRHAGLDLGPVGGFDQQRQQLQRPGPHRRALIVEDVVRDAVQPDLLGDLHQAAVEVGGEVGAGGLGHPVGEAPPGRPHAAVAVAQLVPDAGLGRQRPLGEHRQRTAGGGVGVERQRALGGVHRRDRATAFSRGAGPA